MKRAEERVRVCLFLFVGGLASLFWSEEEVWRRKTGYRFARYQVIVAIGPRVWEIRIKVWEIGFYGRVWERKT